MAYTKHFSAFIAAISLLIILLSGSGGAAGSQPEQSFQAQAAEKESRKAPEAVFQKSQPKSDPSVIENYYASALDNLPITFHPGGDYRADSSPTPAAARRCKSILYRTLSALPARDTGKVKELTLYYTQDGRRGLGGGGSIIIRCLNVTDLELASVLTHEVGHVTDEAVLTGSRSAGFSGFRDFEKLVAADDPSALFYKISWVSESKKKSVTSKLDFVSIYAATDPFEDFAETYTYYRWHGAEFRALAKSNTVLNEKYEFMKLSVFSGQEFGDLTKEIVMDTAKRHYDVTVLPIIY